jgi:hypothetical protein
VLDRLVEDGFFFLRLDEADLQIVRDMRAAASRFLASSEGLDAMSRRSMLYLKTSAAGYAEAPEINSFQVRHTPPHAIALEGAHISQPRQPSHTTDGFPGPTPRTRTKR